MAVSVILIIIGFVLLIKGADFLVDGASNVAKKFHIPEMIIGLTIVSIGTSMPELVVSVSSALSGRSDMAIGNVIGSNLVNLLFILGVSAAIKTIKIQKETRKIDIPICLAITVIFMILCNIGQGISRIDAVILVALFVAFIAYTIIAAKKSKEMQKAEDASKEKITVKSVMKDILFIILGIATLKIGGDLTVDNAVKIAEYFNLSEKIIAITILAIGTSLPELVTSVAAAMKGKSDIAIGNILGSNIFNMLLIIGTSSLIRPISYNVSYNSDLMILILGTLILAAFPYFKPFNRMDKVNGFVYIALYALYMGISFVK